MAFYTNNLESPAQPSAAFAFFNSIAGFFDRLVASKNRSAAVHSMQELSDRQLADIGLNRADIVRHVYRDIYYI